jgi:DNA-binding MarR family transcriptional regulator
MPAGPDHDVPRRELTDPRALRAVAHPVRLVLLEQLAVHGPSTATELAERLQDQSPANCSWHLRQLARYGFIEEAGSGPGRQRRWKLTVESTSIADSSQPELVRAADAFDSLLMQRALANRQAWQATRLSEPKKWRDASFSSHGWAWMTANEMNALQADFTALLERHLYPVMDRFDPANRPPGSRPAQLVMWLVPTGLAHQADETTSDTSEEIR